MQPQALAPWHLWVDLWTIPLKQSFQEEIHNLKPLDHLMSKFSFSFVTEQTKLGAGLVSSQELVLQTVVPEFKARP